MLLRTMVAILLRNPFVAGGRISPGAFLRLLHHELVSKPFTTCPSSPNSDLAASFFKTSCGLSPSAALAAASRLNMKTTENAESVLRILASYGFDKSNIALMAAKQPILFSFHPEKCIKPKLDLFIAAGFTGNFITNLFSKYPSILTHSLERKLSPNLHLLMTTLGGDRKIVGTSIDRCTPILVSDLKKNVLPNIEMLREHGVPATNIAKLIGWWPRAITQKHDRFSKTVALLEDMGFDPSNTLFIQGIQVNVGLTQPTWERKLQLYYSLGWSQEETLSAFKKCPSSLLISEEKVRKVVAFFVENLKWEPSRLALQPILLRFSFEKRIVPKYAVFNILSTRGLLGTNMSFSTLLRMSESTFLKKYVWKYSDTIPELLDAYKVKLDNAVAVPSN
ncbi:hypothetical protein KSP40_PGU015617 [Platanthera guangdongensis]|uniref:Uncharacterized protein n=1 Tax=Platanthera guangdongensis TaxID=2320717 RepID=A0ABR2LEA3_9ASPA